MANLQVISNLKIITSGQIPTVETLTTGQAAFGKITSDGKYHLYGNSDGVVKDIVLDSVSDLATTNLQGILTNGNTTNLSIVFDDESGNTVLLQSSNIHLTSSTSEELDINASTGFKDNNYPVLTANPNRTIDASQATTMRNFLDVFSKSEVTAKISGVYKYKGTVATFAELIAKEDYTPEIGDVWNIEQAGGTDKNGTAIKSGDNIAFVGPAKTTDWDVLAGIIDLSQYYTKSEIDTTVDGLNVSIGTANTNATEAKQAAQAAQEDIDTANQKITAIENAGYQTAADVNKILTDNHYVTDENYVHTDNNYTTADKTKVDKLVTNGDGTKILTDNGTWQQLELTIVSI